MSFTLPSVRSELILSRDSAKSSFLGSHLLFLSQPIKCHNKRANTYTLCFSNVPFSISSKHYIDVFPLHTDVKNACIKTIQHFQCTAPVLLCHHNTVSLSSNPPFIIGSLCFTSSASISFYLRVTLHTPDVALGYVYVMKPN